MDALKCHENVISDSILNFQSASHMICWGTWEENGFTFVSVSSTDDKSESEEDFPRYIFVRQKNFFSINYYFNFYYNF